MSDQTPDMAARLEAIRTKLKAGGFAVITYNDTVYLLDALTEVTRQRDEWKRMHTSMTETCGKQVARADAAEQALAEIAAVNIRQLLEEKLRLKHELADARENGAELESQLAAAQEGQARVRALVPDRLASGETDWPVAASAVRAALAAPSVAAPQSPIERGEKLNPYPVAAPPCNCGAPIECRCKCANCAAGQHGEPVAAPSGWQPFDCLCDCVNCATGKHEDCYYDPSVCPAKVPHDT